MTLLFTALLKVWLPIAMLCACFYIWSRRSKSAPLAAVLRRTAILGAAFFGVLIVAIVAILNTCDGTVLQGVSNCAPLPDIIARIVVSLGYTSTAMAILYSLLLVGVGAVIEAMQPSDN